MYRVEYKQSVAKDIRAIPKPELKKIVKRILWLADDPRRAGCIKLHGESDVYRVRQGDYRIIYTIQDELITVTIIKIGHRRDVYER